MFTLSRKRGFSQPHQQLQKLVDFCLLAKVVKGVGLLFPADTNGNDISSHGEGILVIFVITHEQGPIATQTILLLGQSIPFMWSFGHHKVQDLLTSKHTNIL